MNIFIYWWPYKSCSPEEVRRHNEQLGDHCQKNRFISESLRWTWNCWQRHVPIFGLTSIVDKKTAMYDYPHSEGTQHTEDSFQWLFLTKKFYHLIILKKVTVEMWNLKEKGPNQFVNKIFLKAIWKCQKVCNFFLNRGELSDNFWFSISKYL